MSIVFEKEWVQSFTVIADGEVVALDSIVSARVYSGQPSSVQKADHAYSGADAVVATTDSGDFVDNSANAAGEWLITLPGIDNPDATKSGGYKEYYLVVSYKAASGDDTQSVVETLFVYYPESQLSRFGVVASDVYGYESKIEKLKGDTWTTGKITLAEESVLEQWASDGIDREYVKEGDGDKLVKLQAVVLACIDLLSDDRDQWQSKLELWSDRYGMVYSRIKIGVDRDKDRAIEPKEKQTPSSVGFMVA